MKERILSRTGTVLLDIFNEREFNFWKSRIIISLAVLTLLLVGSFAYSLRPINRHILFTGGSNQKTLTKIVVKHKAIIPAVAINKNLYVVKYGDNLSKIAGDKLGDQNKWTVLAKINHIGNPDIISVGQKIELKLIPAPKIASGESGINSPNSVKTYPVYKGDSLWSIAQKVYGDPYRWTEIAKLNNLSNPGLIYYGQVLRLT